ncbi:MAG: sensor domain-containing diguanylate cyclase [Gammaproteobacteria bacterium]|nr:sensor domain-containing diguanylate cyclase [Gammaproteobacteria bacterium]
MPDTRPSGDEPDSRLDAELREARAQIALLTSEAQRNEQLFQRLHERELDLMRIDSLPRLLEAITNGLLDSYGLDAVVLALSDPQHEIRHLLQGDGYTPAEFHSVSFCESVLPLLPAALLAAPRAWVGPCVAADHQLLFPQAQDLGSIAIMPLTRGGRSLGVLGFGSRDAQRFTRRHATDFMEHLAAIVAFCLENACNRSRLARAGFTDYLTGWHNKRYLSLRLREELARAQRLDAPVAMLMIDIDHFKAINDRCGHLGGDAAIREVALRVESQIRQSDSAARFGGDEFAVLLPGTGASDAIILGQRIRIAVSGMPAELLNGMECTLTLSIGVSALTAPRDGDLKALADRLIAEADAALYRAKALGRDRVELHA